jgi:putative transcriptional regulator
MGLTQERFAAKLGVTFPTINRWENGRVWPSPLALQQLRTVVHELEGDGGPLAARLENALGQ